MAPRSSGTEETEPDTVTTVEERSPSSPVAARPQRAVLWRAGFAEFLRKLLGTARDLAPIVVVVVFFQLAVLQRPFPNLGAVLIGLLLVMIGLALFLRGLDMALFPIGEAMGHAFAGKGSLPWLLVFAFALGFGTTVAEPALIAIAAEAAEAAAAAGVIVPEEQAAYALGLRYTVAVSVGFAILIGVLRILKGWPVHWLIMSGYVLVVALTAVAPADIVGVAYDSGGVTTSTITVPLVAALGIGLATVIKGRSPLIDGFGLIAFASLTPVIFVLLYGMIV